MGFIAELEAGEMELLRKIPQGDYTVENADACWTSASRTAAQQTLFHETALNDAVITKGAIARVVQLSSLLRRCGGDELLRRRRDPLHADRVDGLFHVRRRADRRAVCQESS